MSMYNNKFVIICFDSNSQTSEPISNLKSPTVDLEGEQEPTNEDLDTNRKRKTTSDVWEHFTSKKVDGKFKA